MTDTPLSSMSKSAPSSKRLKTRHLQGQCLGSSDGPRPVPGFDPGIGLVISTCPRVSCYASGEGRMAQHRARQSASAGPRAPGGLGGQCPDAPSLILQYSSRFASVFQEDSTGSSVPNASLLTMWTTSPRRHSFVSGRDARGCDPRKSRGSCLRSQGVLPLNTVGRGVAMHGISLRCSPSTPKAVASRILETSLPRERSLLSYSRRFHACLSASERLSRSSTWGICPAMKCHAPLGFEGSLSMTMTGKPGGVS